MMKARRENIKSPRRKNNLTINCHSNKLQKSSSISTASAATLPQPQSDTIKVVVRVRPLNAKETDKSCRSIINVIDENILIFDPKEKDEAFFFHGVRQKTRNVLGKAPKELQFAFNRVFGWDVENSEIFENTTKPLIKSLMDGMNCSVFAYGATGAGKTYTMLGNAMNPGITYLTMEHLFNTMEQLKDERDFELGITYLEVYNEIVQDLLDPGAILQLREDHKGGVMVAGIKYVRIARVGDLYSLLEQGNKNRTQHPTDANAESSRSHAVFQVYMQMTTKITQEVRFAKLSMIDLAGSERASATGCQGARFAEGANINKSLLALGNCINSLAASQRHIPYRDSKLTRLLKDSLGGNCQTVMIANISPSSASYEDTYNTLRYATRAKSIKANIRRNVLSVDLKMDDYVKIIEELKKKNASLEKENEELKSWKEQHHSKEADEVQSISVDAITNRLKEVIEKLYTMDISQQIVRLRSEFKEETNSRLSGLCCDMTDKEDRHRRLENTIYRCKKQYELYEEQIKMLNVEKKSLKEKANDLAEQHPELKSTVKSKILELMNLEEKLKNQLAQKNIDIYREQHRQEGELIEKLCSMLKPFYVQLKVQGNLSDNSIAAYESLISQMQGIKNIKWEDDKDSDIPDSGICSPTTVVVIKAPEPSKCPSTSNEFMKSPMRSPLTKRCPPPLERIPIGDVTFSVNTPKKKTTTKNTLKVSRPKLCSDLLLVEGYKPSPLKRPKMNSTTSSRMKENWPSLRSARGPMSHRNDISIQPSTSKATSFTSRPPFRR